MTKRLSALGFVAVIALAASACLLKDRTDTWYLEASGAVSWEVVEKDVRSDAKTPFDRQAEEDAYFTRVRNRNHPVAKGLAELGALNVRTRILREDRPYSVVTDGRFTSLENLGRQLILAFQLTGMSSVQRDGETMTWTFTIRDPHSPDGQPSKVDDDLSELTNGFERLKIVLVQGAFVNAKGFDISSDRRVATVAKPDDETADKFDAGEPVVWKLVWRKD